MRCADTHENNGLFKTSAVIEGERGGKRFGDGEIKRGRWGLIGAGSGMRRRKCWR